jgi:hypothetical protein
LLSTLNPTGRAHNRTGFTGKQKFLYRGTPHSNENALQDECKMKAKAAKITFKNKLCVVFANKILEKSTIEKKMAL